MLATRDHLFSSRPYLAAVFGLSTAAHVWLIAHPLRTLIEKLLADDAFYYFVLARNIAEGHGIVFTPGIPTNGFHPLFAAVLVPLAALTSPFGDAALPYAALILLSLTHLATGWLIYRLVSFLRAPAWGLLAAAFWTLNPFMIFINLRGLEVGLFVVGLALMTHLYVRKCLGDQADRNALGLLGLVAGLTCLARFEGIIYVAVIWADLFLGREPVSPRFRPRWRAFFEKVRPFAAGFIPVFGVWTIFSLTQWGKLLPSSGSILKTYAHEGGGFGAPLHVAKTIAGNFAGMFLGISNTHAFQVTEGTGLQLVAVAALAVAGAVLLLRWRSNEREIRTNQNRLRFLFVGMILQYAAYALYTWYIRRWYFLGGAFVLTLFVFASLPSGLLSTGKSALERRLAFLLLIMTSVFTVVGAAHYIIGNAPWSVTMVRAGEWIAANLPEDAKIGAFNTGIVRFYAGRDLVNLDGVMNNEACDYIRSNGLDQYLEQAGIEYIVDPSIESPVGATVEMRSRWTTDPEAFLERLEPVKEFRHDFRWSLFPERYDYQIRTVYRLRDPDSSRTASP